MALGSGICRSCHIGFSMITWGLYIFGGRDTDFYTNIWIKLSVILIPCTRQVTIKVEFSTAMSRFLGVLVKSPTAVLFPLPPPCSLPCGAPCPAQCFVSVSQALAAGTQDCPSLSSSSKGPAGAASGLHLTHGSGSREGPLVPPGTLL